MRELRPKEARTRRIMIAGGGNIGYRLAKQLESKYDIKIIEYKPHRAEWLAENLDNTLVLQGSATDETLLDEEYIDENRRLLRADQRRRKQHHVQPVGEKTLVPNA